jgi:DNA-binding MarR family transcriptional regulator
MAQRDLPSWICTALMRIGTRMATGFDRRFAGLGVTQAQFRLLLAVRRVGQHEGIAPSALADSLLIERPTVTVLAAGLIERGLLARSPGANRRTHRLRLTAEGEELLRRVVPHAAARAEELLAGLDDEMLQQVRAVLGTLEERLREGHAAPGSGSGSDESLRDPAAREG